jgi:hypothetical protein
LSAWAADGVPEEEQRATRSAGAAPWRAAAVARGGVDQMVESSGQRRSACVVGIVAAGTAPVAPPSALDTTRDGSECRERRVVERGGGALCGGEQVQ